MDEKNPFQGVACCTLDREGSVQENIFRLLDLNDAVNLRGISCQRLRLDNKYYQTSIHLFELRDDDKLINRSLLADCQAIILHCNGPNITTEQLDERISKLDCVGGEPRILLYEGIDEDSPAHKTVVEWCIDRGFDFIDASDKDNAKVELINSLSAYRWTHLTDVNSNSSQSENQANERELDDETLKKLQDFDNLLRKFRFYKDNPESRGDPGDQKITEIAEILSGLLSNDVDDFLENDQFD